MAHEVRNLTIMGKVSVLNYVGYSKFWHKSMALMLPDFPCLRDNGKYVNIKNEIEYLTNGFIWSFFSQDNTENSLENNNRRTKQELISTNTLFLNKNDGGTGLIDYNTKLKAFRILLIYKYFDNKDRPWKSIVRYWFCSTLRVISNEEWNNQFPHTSDINDVPQFFRQCISDFKEYYSNFGNSINEKCNTKSIYDKLLRQKNHIPTSFIRFPEYSFNGYFEELNKSNFLDPYLREFLFKLYHARLVFKRYKLNINDMLNFDRDRCTLCNISIETPKHIFTICKFGLLMRNKRKFILQLIHLGNRNLSQENLIYSIFRNNDRVNKILQFIITVSNYCMYKAKMKKYYNVDTEVSDIQIAKSFIDTVKDRIMVDHKRMNVIEFKETWDPGGTYSILTYTDNEITGWNI